MRLEPLLRAFTHGTGSSPLVIRLSSPVRVFRHERDPLQNRFNHAWKAGTEKSEAQSRLRFARVPFLQKGCWKRPVPQVDCPHVRPASPPGSILADAVAGRRPKIMSGLPHSSPSSERHTTLLLVQR